ncbi:hypothetical protein T492DRAFT_179081 [Pavlovales sp. CCMP2436]|nr:hypothetical protein T492DRAFT_179081 [Pavlovales sp. CCMP2436]
MMTLACPRSAHIPAARTQTRAAVGGYTPAQSPKTAGYPKRFKCKGWRIIAVFSAMGPRTHRAQAHFADPRVVLDVKLSQRRVRCEALAEPDRARVAYLVVSEVDVVSAELAARPSPSPPAPASRISLFSRSSVVSAALALRPSPSPPAPASRIGLFPRWSVVSAALAARPRPSPTAPESRIRLSRRSSVVSVVLALRPSPSPTAPASPIRFSSR